ncbi:hypothetical protein FPOAC2_12785 [Fusarium poae]|jgi:hypothetical protein|uniref:hypothetical protein n=1 Tax=Fusarium poae TaxID=36050 RepID=UPI001CEA38FC|nr:hypothetical protein FPOAC1_012444 [Fusarium poae]KAG8667611.1 hypothetical protein FPOAC1_012444 [Fusarium poae]
MAAKTPLSQASYQPVPRDDPTADLLEPSERDDREDGKPPLLRVKFSFILFLRLLVTPLVIADIVFMCNPYYSPASAGIFATGGILLAFWHGFRVLKSCFPSRSRDNFNLKIGSLFCMCGTTSNSHTRSSKVWAYLVSLVDFSFGLFLIGPSVTALRYDNFRDNAAVGGLSITLVVMQSTIAVLNLFSLFRQMTIAVYRDDGEQDRLYSIPELFRDEASEPRDSMSSEV